MSKQGEKRLTAKTNIFMKKYEQIYGTFMVFAVFSINLVLGPFWNFFSEFSKKVHIQKVHIKNNIYYLIWCHWT